MNMGKNIIMLTNTSTERNMMNISGLRLKMLKNYQTLLSSLSDAFITSLSYDDIASLVQMQLQDMSGWHVTSYAVSGSGDTSYCYALGDAAWVMRPNMDTVNTAKELIRQVMSGETPQIP